MIGGVDLAPLAKPGGRGLKLMLDLYDAGCMVKMTGDCALASPPLVAEDKHIDEIFTNMPGVLASQSAGRPLLFIVTLGLYPRIPRNHIGRPPVRESE